MRRAAEGWVPHGEHFSSSVAGLLVRSVSALHDREHVAVEVSAARADKIIFAHDRSLHQKYHGHGKEAHKQSGQLLTCHRPQKPGVEAPHVTFTTRQGPPATHRSSASTRRSSASTRASPCTPALTAGTNSRSKYRWHGRASRITCVGPATLSWHHAHQPDRATTV